MDSSFIKKNIENIQNKINDAITRSGREINSVKLMAVSKFHSVEEIEAAIECGIKLFGENRVQEIAEKFPAIFEKYNDIELHMIGSLQRNKVKQVLPFVKSIQSVDRIELINEIEKQGQKISLEKPINVFFEVHTGEESKSGFQNIDDLYFAIEKTASSKIIKPIGFMTMAPFTDNKNIVRDSFKKLNSIAIKARDDFPELNLCELSMGMSGDYEIAIEEGSTLVRIGTSIFGQRK